MRFSRELCITASRKDSIVERERERDGPSNLSILNGFLMGSELVLSLSENRISGTIPLSLWNLSSLKVIGLAVNELTGELPADLGRTLPRLERLLLNKNRIHGEIPVTLANNSALESIELQSNNLRGTIPSSLGTLQRLSRLLLGSNYLEAEDDFGWGFLDALTNCSNLQSLSLNSNNFNGFLPRSISNLSSRLERLRLDQNWLSGTIPVGIGNLVNLDHLDLQCNMLTGSIPSSITKLSRLGLLNLDINQLSGEIPSDIGNLTGLIKLSVAMNNLSGRIPISLAKCPLNMLNLGFNRLGGEIPEELLAVPTLSVYIRLSHNSLVGTLPSNVGKLRNLKELDISKNKLSGNIPRNIGECLVLAFLNLYGNHFTGTIPLSLQNVRGLQWLDLSCNNLSGTVPKFLETFPFLTYLNLSFNDFEGEVPRGGVFGNLSKPSLLGNNRLCGGQKNLNIPPCPVETGRRNLTLILFVVNAFLCIILLVAFVTFYKKLKLSNSSDPMNEANDGNMNEIPIPWRYGKEVPFDVLFNATDEFSTANLIGRGSFGAVYKGTIEYEGESFVAAVKVLDLQRHGASKSFLAECKALRHIRHRNLVKVFVFCSSLDFGGNEFKALVFEYMPNGSLDTWLHPGSYDLERDVLSLIQRLNIAIDVACALDYLHNNGTISIAHCDVKPCNVLLDRDMSARVGDFGLARFLAENTGQNQSCSIGLRGSIGYVAPEYGMANKASTQGDVYSYGVLLLEMFTGKRPTDDAFDNGMSLVKFAELALNEDALAIVDPGLVLDGEDQRMHKFFRLIFKIGISCTQEFPKERMNMGNVTKELVQLKVEQFQTETSTE